MSFRQFGGLNYSARNNIVASNYNTSNNLLVTQNVGQSNSYINFLSDISGNQIFGNVDVSGNLYVSGNAYIFGDTIGATGSFSYLSASQVITAPAGITGSSANFSAVTTSGTVTASSFNATSDYRIKENVIPLNNTSYTIDPLIPVTYLNMLTEKQDIGLIAHNVQEHIPILVTGEKDGKEQQTINYIGLIPILIKEIQELKKEITLLKERLMN